MKLLFSILLIIVMLCGCTDAVGTESSAPADATSSRYIDADTDFTGMVTIVGRWHCISETQNGETRDASEDEIYYIFSSDGTMDSFYQGSEVIDYSGYVCDDGKVTMSYAGNSITLNYTVEETRLTLFIDDGSIKTVYERVDYE